MEGKTGTSRDSEKTTFIKRYRVVVNKDPPLLEGARHREEEYSYLKINVNLGFCMFPDFNKIISILILYYNVTRE